jgi:hypothetical protein
MKRRIIIALVLVLVLLFGSDVANAAGGYSLSWWTVDCGGGTSTSPGYSLSGTVGQPDAGQLGGGSYELSGGFWSWVKSLFEVYLPLVIRN